MKKILILGGCGFIGHNLAQELSKNYQVAIADSLQINNLYSLENNKDNLPNPKLSKTIIEDRLEIIKNNKLKFVIQDLRDYHATSRLFSEIQPDIVIHLAAVSHANRSNKDPHTTFDHSLRTLENALDNSKNKVEKFIYFSSSMVYGNFKSDEVDENSNCDPLGIYAALKFSGEKIVKSYGQVFDLNYTIVRPSALYGERCISRRVGQIFIENALNNMEIIVDGDGEEKLDFTYIKDLVDGVKKIIESKKSDKEIFNITYGSSRKINEMIEILKQNFDTLDVKYKRRDKLMPVRGTLNIDKAKDLLNYQPSWPLEKGYPNYINWYKEIFKVFNEIK
jgi:nucleoside-diphosphate-sugar epimerase